MHIDIDFYEYIVNNKFTLISSNITLSRKSLTFTLIISSHPKAEAELFWCLIGQIV